MERTDFFDMAIRMVVEYVKRYVNRDQYISEQDVQIIDIDRDCENNDMSVALIFDNDYSTEYNVIYYKDTGCVKSYLKHN